MARPESRTVDPAIEQLALDYDKPVAYVVKCMEAHNVKLPLPKFRTPDDGLGPFYSDMTAHFDLSPSRTKQEFTAECDINNIIARFKASDFDISTLPRTARRAMYGDFTNMPESYHAALNFVKGAEESFMTLPAEIRSRFDNDPQKFLNFIDDPKNHDELVEMGLFEKPPVPDGDDLSPGDPQRAQHAGGGSPGGKSPRTRPAAVTPSNGVPEGYKLVPDTGGIEEV